MSSIASASTASNASSGISAGLISAGGNLASSLVSGLIGSHASRHAQRRQFNYNKELMRIQNEYAVENWNRENEYNLPANQVKRLKDAGINPALYFGNNGGSTGESGSLPAPSQSGVSGSPASFDSSGIGRALEDGITAFYRVSLQKSQIRAQELANQNQEYHNEYMRRWIEQNMPSVMSAEKSNADLQTFNAKSNLHIMSTDQIMFEDGAPSGYVDDDGYHSFNRLEKSLAEQYLSGDFQFQKLGQQWALEGKQMEENIRLTMKHVDDIINQMKNRNKITDAQANALSKQANLFKQQANSIKYEMEQLKLTEDSDGKNVNTRMKELQTRSLTLQQDYTKWQLEMKQKYGEAEEVINNIVIPMGQFVGQIVGAAAMFFPQTRALGVASSLLGVTVGRSQQASPAPQLGNPFVSQPAQNMVQSYGMPMNQINY